jgi:gliding motility-associated-like protein
MKNLYLVIFIFLIPLSMMSQVLRVEYDALFGACVGDTTTYFIDFDVLGASANPDRLDSIRWVFEPNDITSPELAFDTTVIASTYIFNDSAMHSTSFPITFTDEVKTNMDAPAEQFSYIHVYYYVVYDGIPTVGYLFTAMGDFYDCPIRYTNFTSDRKRICAGSCVQFRDSSDRYPRNHLWYFEGGTPAYSEERVPPPICYETPGKYAVKHVVGNSVSADSLTIEAYIEVLDAPILVSDTANIVSGFKGDSILLNACVEAIYYSWTPSEGLSCTDCPNPVLTLDLPRTYRLNAWNDPDCVVECRYNIQPQPKENKIYVPNIFSPNGDSNNDFFEVAGTFFELQNMTIYDRWGNMLYESSGNDSKWDGRLSGRELPPAVYVYRIIYYDTFTNQQVYLTGTVTIVR